VKKKKISLADKITKDKAVSPKVHSIYDVCPGKIQCDLTHTKFAIIKEMVTEMGWQYKKKHK
jgi:hypothetical protein